MNVEQALNVADESDFEGLRGLYPTIAQVLTPEFTGGRLYRPSGGMICYA